MATLCVLCLTESTAWPSIVPMLPGKWSCGSLALLIGRAPHGYLLLDLVVHTSTFDQLLAGMRAQTMQIGYPRAFYTLLNSFTWIWMKMAIRVKPRCHHIGFTIATTTKGRSLWESNYWSKFLLSTTRSLPQLIRCT